jgi:hypothetical protein
MVTDFGLAALVADKIRSDALPVPPEPPQKYFAGKGTGQRCDVCEQAISAEELEYEVDVDGRRLRIHEKASTCGARRAAEICAPMLCSDNGGSCDA